ncbi:unnamed protein product [Polarella glacialis]|uniref:Uncharacterized protein n=1 Tax=Polarella glacialis TaxID=89957 RepID=A0A813FJ05_POLGL|nr:unnamed protein product [Polarella glacialis]CAE8651569.1 unnamed protein product [Polarella glacialis]
MAAREDLAEADDSSPLQEDWAERPEEEAQAAEFCALQPGRESVAAAAALVQTDRNLGKSAQALACTMSQVADLMLELGDKFSQAAGEGKLQSILTLVKAERAVAPLLAVASSPRNRSDESMCDDFISKRARTV